VGRDFSRPQSPRRVSDLVRHLSESAEQEQDHHERLALGVSSLLDAAADGPEGLSPLLHALAGSAAGIDAAGVLVRAGSGFELLAAIGLEMAADAAPDGLAAAAAARRQLVVAGGEELGPPLPPGTLVAAAMPILSRGEVLALVLVGSRSVLELGRDDLLLVRVLAERAGRTLERAALVEALTGAETVARKTTSFRDQVLGIVGHDLRNPLGAVSMSGALLAKRGGLGGWQQKTVSRIRSSAARMERIIDDLLSYTRTRLGTGIPIERQPADLAELARKVVDELVAFHPDSPIHLEAQGDLAGEWDPTRVEQLLSNVLSNAVDHGDPESRIEVRLSGDGAVVRAEVRNRGEMPPGVLDHLFEPFQRAPEREGRRSTGLGLGLFIAREIARGHGGRIEARSQRGETFVWVELPRRAASAHPPPDRG
jgi:signal transduction histidine kinase